MTFIAQSGRRRFERGYILLTLMFAVALMAIAAAAIAPTLAFQAKRDREEELIHRGVQYSRAVRRYFKKFGRYPTRIEDLESSNNMRFLRKRYKDPITNQDFKLLHFGEVQMAMGGGIVGGGSPGTPIGNGPAGTVQSTRFSMNGSSNAGGPQNLAGNQGQPQGTGGSDSDANSSSGNSSSGSQGINPAPGAGGNGGGSSSGQTFGGGPIVGVASTSKAESIREFNNKNHYNQWQFIYDPSTDRGGLLNTPAQPPLQNVVAVPPGVSGTPGTPGATGAPGGFGAPSPGMGNGISPLGPQTPAPMQNQPQPQTPAQPQQP